jgi:alpha-ketoglutarate-dependent taurine dioxygenase
MDIRNLNNVPAFITKDGSEIRELLELRGALVFPRIDLTDEEQLAFSRTLGDIVEQGEKGIYKVTLDVKVTPTAEYLRGTVLWHIDGFSDDLRRRVDLGRCGASPRTEPSRRCRSSISLKGSQRVNVFMCCYLSWRFVFCRNELLL